jgi:hypothetical protein
MDRVIIPGPPESFEEIKINVTDDFKVVYPFRDLRMTPPIKIDLDLFNIKFDFYIKGRPEHYIAEKVGDDCTNCILDKDNSIIKVIFDSHGLGAGKLYCTHTFYFPDPDFPDGFSTSSVTKYMNIVLIDNIY